MFVQRLVRLDRLSEVHVQGVFKLQLEVRKSVAHRMGSRYCGYEVIPI